MIRIGLLDSGLDGALEGAVAASASFTGAPLVPDGLGHGTALARIILHHAPDASLLNAQAFGSRLRSSPGAVACALRWLIDQEARLVNMSIGLRDDRDALRRAVATAIEGGVVVVASTPARGGAVFPAAYPGVLRITGDARCGPDEVSALGGEPADYGACPHGIDGTPGGASFAVAHVTGLLARGLAEGGDPRTILERHVAYRGRERRSG